MKKLFPTILLYIGIFVFFPACGSQKQSNGHHDTALRIEKFFNRLHEGGLFSGTALIAEGESEWSYAVGTADEAKNIPLETDMQFYLCSVSKQFTAMAIMLLKQEGNISYDDLAQTYLPELPEQAKTITIRHMLTHTSGLKDYYDLGAYKDGMTNTDVLQVAQRTDSLNFSPGTDYSYSNTAYVLLSVIVERVSGLSFRAFLDKNIFTPAGMEASTVFDESKPSLAKKVIGYTNDGEINDYTAFTTGGGGIFSNVFDLRKWDKILYTEQLISQEALKEAFNPYVLQNDKPSYYGFGWRLTENAPHIVQHSGSLAGFRTYFYRDMKKKRSIILLSNHTDDVSVIKDQLVTILNDNLTNSDS